MVATVSGLQCHDAQMSWVRGLSSSSLNVAEQAAALKALVAVVSGLHCHDAQMNWVLGLSSALNVAERNARRLQAELLLSIDEGKGETHSV